MKAHDDIAEAVPPESKIRTTSGMHCIQNRRRLHFSGGKKYVKYNKPMVQTKIGKKKSQMLGILDGLLSKLLNE